MSVEELLERPFHVSGKRPCWPFCQAIMRELGRPVVAGVHEMARTETPAVGDVVLLRSPEPPGWHAGVIWPDGLHFVHYTGRPAAARDGLTAPHIRSRIDGYYTVRGV